MGPRLFGQGKPYSNFTAVPVTALQWGLACSGKVRGKVKKVNGKGLLLQWGLACSGKVSAAPAHTGIVIYRASMGPRLFGQGKVYRHLVPSKGGAASMGPRLFGQGKMKAYRRRMQRQQGLQWGLACSGKVRNRKSLSGSPPCWLQWGLACSGKVSIVIRCDLWQRAVASMGPRLFGQGKFGLEVRIQRIGHMLQWGLACSGKVRAARGPRPGGRRAQLQWGLACSGKVRAEPAAGRPGQIALQWGLACSGKVSCGFQRQHPPDSPGFNGASPVRAR